MQDSTLISTRSGKLHAESLDDWAWWHEVVPAKLRELRDRCYEIVILTNQGRLTDRKGEQAPEAHLFKLKVEAVLRALDIPLTLYAACANDNYRKPRTGMWELLTEECRMGGRFVEREYSYLIGDSAGRDKDHSDSDRHFCMNVGISFYTPEEFFLNEPPEHMCHKFDPAWYLAANRNWEIMYPDLPDTLHPS
jgi:bifunctional polynucleotide phosphatase/kinase